jgi:NADP-dependent 3-hydroxy acid dehydrogenase YdfG
MTGLFKEETTLMSNEPRRIAVTGATGGIGRAIAMRLAKDGHQLIVSDRSAESLTELTARLPGGGHSSYACDLRSPAQRADLADQASQADILVNAAGWQRQTPFLKGSPEDDARTFEVNALAPIDLCRRIGARMAARGDGHIVNVSSALARAVYPYTTVYAATKHALAALTQGLRVELSDHGVRVTEICPGLVGGTGILDATDDPQVLASIGQRGYEPMSATHVADAVAYAVRLPANVELRLLEIRPRGQV